MVEDQGERPAATSLKGRLSDVYFPALLEGALEPLGARLGARATVDEPRLGRASGLVEIEEQLERSSAWWRGLGATYTRRQFTSSADRDVTEGTVVVRKEGRTLEAPVAVVAERRRSREIDLRVYYPTRLLCDAPVPRGEIASERRPAVLPALVAEHVAAMRRGDVNAILACYEENASFRDSAGRALARADGAALAYLEKAAPWDARPIGYADDGRTCAIEYTLVRFGGADVASQIGMTVFERGESGLFCAARVYDDV
jgi:hypothetical protein